MVSCGISPGLAAVATSALAPLCLDGSFVVGPGVARAPHAQGPTPSVPAFEMNGSEEGQGTRTVEIWIVGPVLKIYQHTRFFHVFLMWVCVFFLGGGGPRKTKHLDPEGV